MNKIWIGIIAICTIYGLVTGRFEEMTTSLLALPMDGLQLVCTLVFSACFWSGVMMIMYDSGLIDKLAKLLNPFLRKIMPNLNDEEAYKYVAMNIAANIFGLGFAATPAGLKAIKRMKELSKESDKSVATDEMVTFLVLNTAGVTILPTTVMAIRQSYGSANPADFLLLSFFGTLASCIFGLLLDKYYQRKAKKKHGK